MRINVRQFGATTVLGIAGPIVAGKCDGLLEAAVRRQVRAGRRHLVADLGCASTIDAAGLGALVAAYTIMRDEGGRFRLADVPKRIHHLLVTTRLNTVFDIVDWREHSAEQPVAKDAVWSSGQIGSASEASQPI
ncbi:MAG: STAS domain-containing protein [Vicinamibacterales bacterium]